MQSLMGKERAIRALNRKREIASFVRLSCPSLLILAPLVTSCLTKDPSLVTLSAAASAAVFIPFAAMEMNTDLEIMSQCVGRPRLAKAMARQYSGGCRPIFEKLGGLDRLNSTQKDLLQNFFLAPQWLPEEDREIVCHLLNRDQNKNG
ncbi:Uncharacterised protein [uncultured archaeon]|nr:Uncharacterised protein [uncultured archaeon]